MFISSEKHSIQFYAIGIWKNRGKNVRQWVDMHDAVDLGLTDDLNDRWQMSVVGIEMTFDQFDINI